MSGLPGDRPHPVERGRVRVYVVLPAGGVAQQWECGTFRFRGGVLLLADAFVQPGNPNDRTPLVAFWPLPGSVVLFSDAGDFAESEHAHHWLRPTFPGGDWFCHCGERAPASFGVADLPRAAGARAWTEPPPPG